METAEIPSTVDQAVASAQFPIKLQPLFKKSRYKILYGGRGGAKSWGIARALLILGAKKQMRILCAREFQASIKDSVHKLLSDQIEALGLFGFYEITQNSIRGANGTEFAFIGLKNNPTNIKSFEGVDVCWVEEGQTVSRLSWNILIPTIRKQGSEIWVSFNPDLETDETYQRFVAKPPRDAILIKINWSDNPWFPETLKAEKDALRERDLNAYNNVWEGMCRRTVDGAIFANEIQRAEAEDRITRVPYDPAKPVHAVCDLGWSDATAWWFVQFVGMETRLIKYFEGSQRTMTSYLAQLQTFGYVYDTIWLPHDAENKTLAANGRSIEEIVRAAGFRTSIMPRVPIVDSINAARTIFPNLWFDRDNCADGLNCLRHYRYEVDPETGLFSKNPLHDHYSHGADAFRYIALMIKEPAKPRKRPVSAHMGGWMG
jgi:phage terminase large subunit